MKQLILYICLLCLPEVGWAQVGDTLASPPAFGAWQPREHPKWAVGLRTRFGGISYWSEDRTVRISRMVVDVIPSVHYFVAPSWALGVQANQWGFSTGNDTAFTERAEGSSLTFSVRKYWWQTGTKIWPRPYMLNFYTEAQIGGTNLDFLPSQVIQTGQRGQGFQHLYGELNFGVRFRCLPNVFLAIDRCLLMSINEGVLRAVPSWGELGLELIW